MNFEDIIVKVDKPYPEIIGATEDYTTVAVLKNLENNLSILKNLFNIKATQIEYNKPIVERIS